MAANCVPHAAPEHARPLVQGCRADPSADIERGKHYFRTENGRSRLLSITDSVVADRLLQPRRALLAAPEAASPDDDPGARPRPVRAPAGPGAPAGEPLPATGPLTIKTNLLGPLTVPDGAGRASEIEDLPRRAAIHPCPRRRHPPYLSRGLAGAPAFAARRSRPDAVGRHPVQSVCSSSQKRGFRDMRRDHWVVRQFEFSTARLDFDRR
jgi:hypothetical protein